MEEEVIISEAKEFSEELLQALNKLVHELTDSAKSLTEAEVCEMLVSDATTLLVAIYKGTIVGTISLIVYRVPDKKKGWLENLVVDNSIRGKGIGKKLLEKSISVSKERGVETLYLTSNPSRGVAHLYENFGFEKKETNVFKLSIEV